MRDLEDVRKDIDSIDQELIQLFLKRMDLSEEVVRYKMEHQLPIYDEDREKSVLDDAVDRTKPGAMEPYVRGFLKALMDISKVYQQQLQDGEMP